ncbi:MAG TPA: hypothetical protein VNS46_05855, partial [Nocardioides sp.]|nr:hypothetical protein [Nocardioides sp.]
MSATTTTVPPSRQDVHRVTIEDDASPLVRLIGRTLEDSLRSGHGREVLGGAVGAVVLRSHDTPQVATITVSEGLVDVTAGAALDPATTVVVDLNARFAPVAEPDGDAALAAGVVRALTPPLPHWRDAAARFWDATR